MSWEIHLKIQYMRFMHTRQIGELVALFESTTGFMGTILMKSTTGGSTGLILPDGIPKGSEAPPTTQPITILSSSS